MNQTSDPAEQLVQRDRKGKPLAVWAHGFYLDGEAHAFRIGSDDSEVAQPLSLGEWIGVSVLPSPPAWDGPPSWGCRWCWGLPTCGWGGGGPVAPGWWGEQGGGWLRRVFKTQAYLLDELRGDFHGLRRDYQYLSDGGHFENTAVYELLRPQRARCA